MDLSVTSIIVNYHTAELCISAIKSLMAQDYPNKIVVVENSNDSQEENILKSFNRTLEKSFILLTPGKNLGFSKACNLAFKYSESDYVMLLNPDAYFADQKGLRQLVKFLSENKGAGAISPRTYLDPGLKALMPPMPQLDLLFLASKLLFGSLFLRVFRHFYLKNAVKFWSTSTPLEQKLLSGGVVLLKTEAINDAGGLFDERFFMYFEDNDLYARLRKKNWRLYLHPRAIAVHQYDSAPGHSKKQRHFEISQRKFLKKHYPFLTDSLINLLLKPRNLASSFPSFIKKGRPIQIDIPPQLQKRPCYLIFSPNPHLIPSGAVMCQGSTFVMPQTVWNSLKDGVCYYYSFIPQLQ